MTLEKAQKAFYELIEKNVFTITAKTNEGNPIYHKVWTKKLQITWHGEQDDTSRIGKQHSRQIDYAVSKKSLLRTTELERLL